MHGWGDRRRLRSLSCRCRGAGMWKSLAAVDGISDAAGTGLAWCNEEQASNGVRELRTAQKTSI